MKPSSSLPKWLIRIGLTCLLVMVGAAGGLAIRSVKSKVPIEGLVSALLDPPLRRGTASADKQDDLKTSCNVPLLTVSNDVEKDPRSPRYDPAALAYLGVEPREIFAKEPRNGRWATTLESTIGRQMLADATVMVPQIKGGVVECRTRACKVTWTPGTLEDDKRFERALGLAGPASTYRQVREPDGRNGIIYLFRPVEYLRTQYGDRASDFDASDADAYARTYLARRAMLLSDFRAGKRKLPPLIADARLPEVK